MFCFGESQTVVVVVLGGHGIVICDGGTTLESGTVCSDCVCVFILL